MDEYSKQMLEKYPYLKEVFKDKLLISASEMQELFSNKLNYELLITKLLREPRYRNYLFRVFKGDFPEIKISYIINGDIGRSITLTKMSFLEQVLNFEKDGKIKFTDEDLKIISRLKRTVTYDSFVEDFKNRELDFLIDGQTYRIKGSDIISFIELPEEEYRKIISKNEPFHNIRLDYMFYIVAAFFVNYNLSDSYHFPADLQERLKNILIYKDYDYESINNTFKNTNSSVDQTKVDKDLEAAILDGLNDDYTLLEKAIYIYINMCNILVYNDEYYATEQIGVNQEKHHDINFITQITPQNNEAVCYEFNAIYAYMLNKLGIHFEVYINDEATGYGEGHEFLVFRAGKFLVKADSVDSIFNGDLFNTKAGELPTGLTCINQNKKTKKEFSKILQNVFNNIKDAEKYRQKFYQKVSDVETLQKLYDKNNPVISFSERIKMMIEYVDTSNLTGIAAYNYLLYIRKKLFTEEELDKLTIQIVKNNLPEESTKESTSIALIFVDGKEPMYFIYEPKKELRTISKEELTKLFNDKELESIYNQTEITRKL